MTSVLIIGAGPSGLALAAALHAQGISCRILDKNKAPTQVSKALVMQVRSLELLDRLGLAQEAISHGQLLSHLHFTLDQHAELRLAIDAVTGPYTQPLIVEQSATEALLIKHLEERGIFVEREKELIALTQSKSKVFAVVRTNTGEQERITAQFLAACDGAHSTTRHLLEIPFEGFRYNEEFVLADLKLQSSLEHDTIRAFGSTKGLAAFFPLKGDGRFRLVLLKKGFEGTDGESPSIEEISTHIKELVPFSFNVEETYWTSRFHVSCRSVSQYHKGHVFLVGDAAHIHSPAGGQGMNTGIQDAFNLAWKLALAVNNQASSHLLQSYHDERYPVGQFLLKRTDRLFRIMINAGFWVRFLRRFIGPRLFARKSVQKRLNHWISQTAIRYRKSHIVVQSPTKHNGPLAGDRAFDVALMNTSRLETSLFSIMRQEHRHILLFMSGPACKEGHFRQAIRLGETIQRNHPHTIAIHFIESIDDKRKDIAWNGPLSIDVSAHFHKLYGFKGPGLLLIRPDGYIGMRSDNFEEKALNAYFSKVFGE